MADRALHNADQLGGPKEQLATTNRFSGAPGCRYLTVPDKTGGPPAAEGIPNPAEVIIMRKLVPVVGPLLAAVVAMVPIVGAILAGILA